MALGQPGVDGELPRRLVPTVRRVDVDVCTRTSPPCHEFILRSSAFHLSFRDGALYFVVLPSLPRSQVSHAGVLRAALAMATVCWAVAAHAQTAPAAPLTLDAAIERALTANPSIVAARLRRAAPLATVAIARERPNPEARVEIEREAPTQSYSMALPIETGGKRDRRIDVSQASVGVTDAELARTMLDVRTSVRRAYYTRLVAEARLSLFQDLQGLAGRVRGAAQQLFDAGSVPRLEVLQAELALADAANQVTSAEGAAGAARIQLNTLLALPQDAALALATPLDVSPPATTADTVARAQSASTDIAVFDRLLDEQRARVALAAAMQAPDLVPEATLTRGAEPEFSTGWRLGLSMAVPIFTRHRAGVLLEQAVLTQLTAERDAAIARITGEVTAAATVANAQRQQYVRYRDEIVPQALEVERLADESYRLGRTGIAAYLQALQASRDVRLRTLQAAADYHSALADLERTIGAPLP